MSDKFKVDNIFPKGIEPGSIQMPWGLSASDRLVEKDGVMLTKSVSQYRDIKQAHANGKDVLLDNANGTFKIIKRESNEL